MNTALAWYGIRTKPRFEKNISTHLNAKGYEQYLPSYRSQRRWSDRSKIIELPLFPGYVFCKFDLSNRLPILVIPGVLSIVGVGNTPFLSRNRRFRPSNKLSRRVSHTALGRR
jgi:transcription antitermination factor NusG